MLGFAEQNGLFPFKTIDDVLEENQKLKEENKWMNDVITHNISEIMKQMDDIRDQHAEDITELGQDISSVRTELSEDITILTQQTSSNISAAKAELEEDISSVRTEITEDITILSQCTSANISAAKAELSENISSVRTELTEDITELVEDISSVRTEITEGITILSEQTSANISVVKKEFEEDIDSITHSLNFKISMVKSQLERKHEEDIDNIRNELSSFNQSDIIGKSKGCLVSVYISSFHIGNLSLFSGTILAWTPQPDKTNPQPISLPKCYVLCDGSEITEGIWAGHTTPDLNKSKRFLRGGLVSDALIVEEDSLQEHSHTSTVSDPGHTHGYSAWYNTGGDDVRPGAAPNQLHAAQSASSKSGISMSVTGVTGARKGSETKPKNMNVVFVMKVC